MQDEFNVVNRAYKVMEERVRADLLALIAASTNARFSIRTNDHPDFEEIFRRTLLIIKPPEKKFDVSKVDGCNWDVIIQKEEKWGRKGGEDIV